MAKLVWDKIDERFYKTGLDHGVLYVPNAQGEYDNGFAWNGLLSLDEDFGDEETQPHYFDGVKYLDSYNNGDFQATLSAFTYPDEFLEFEGMGALGGGLYVDDQQSKVFSLSYRTLIGSHHQGLAQGYRIHIVYNLTAIPESLSFQNGSNLPEPIEFGWTVHSVPETASNYNPTSHIILDSHLMSPEILQTIEDVIYGTDGVKPRLPSLNEFLGIVVNYNPKLIISASTTGLAQLVNGMGDLSLAKVPGLYGALPTTRLTETTVPGLSTLQEGI